MTTFKEFDRRQSFLSNQLAELEKGDPAIYAQYFGEEWFTLMLPIMDMTDRVREVELIMLAVSLMLEDKNLINPSALRDMVTKWRDKMKEETKND